MSISGSVGNTAYKCRLHIRGNGDVPCYGQVECQRQAAALALTRGLAAIVLAGRMMVRGPGFRGVGRGRVVQGTRFAACVHSRPRHRIDVHLQPNGELQRQDCKEDPN